EGDTDNTPYGLGTYASRSTPVAGAATGMVSRKLREKARQLAAHLLEANPEDIEFERGKFFVKGSPDQFKTIQDCAFAAYTNFPDYLLPTAWETPNFEVYATVTPSPHHPLGAKGIGESATVGSPAAFVNAVVDAFAHAGVRNLEMPVTSDKVWTAMRSVGVTE